MIKTRSQLRNEAKLYLEIAQKYYLRLDADMDRVGYSNPADLMDKLAKMAHVKIAIGVRKAALSACARRRYRRAQGGAADSLSE